MRAEGIPEQGEVLALGGPGGGARDIQRLQEDPGVITQADSRISLTSRIPELVLKITDMPSRVWHRVFHLQDLGTCFGRCL